MKIIKIIFLSFLLCSCFGPSYPKTWAPIEKPKLGCPEISGSYENDPDIDVQRKEKFHHFRLTNFVKELNGKEQNDTTRVEIEQIDNDLIKFTAWSNKKYLNKSEYYQKNNDFYCSNGQVSIKNESGFFAQKDYGIAGFGKSSLLLTKSIDGSLIIKPKGSGAGIILYILPMASSSWDWLRYKQKQ